MKESRTRRRINRRALGLALTVIAVILTACAPETPGPSKAGEAFKKEVLAAKQSLSAPLSDALAHREPRSLGRILDQTCNLARSKGEPFTCGITVLDRHGITLASATPGGPAKRLDYSRYEVVMKALEERRIVKAKLYLQDRSTIYVVAIPLERKGEVVGIMGLAFDASDLRDRFGLTEQEFMRVDLNG